MATSEAEASYGGSDASSGVTYNGFISYSHAADDLLAPRLQAGLQRFAKPWWKRRALRIFRDESSLSANPHLWSSITEALDSSEWFVLLLSPDAASSEWVKREIEHWVTQKDPSRILPVVTDGEFNWANGDATGTSVPSALHGVFTEEPRWVDLRFARDEEHLDLKNPSFSNAVADIASTIRGVPKDELASEEVRQHRRTVRTAWVAGATLMLLTIAAIGLGFQSASNARLAKARELAASSIAVQDRDPELATLLAVESIRQAGGGADSLFPEGLISLREAVITNRLVARRDFSGNGLVDVAFTNDGSGIIVTSSAGRSVSLYRPDLLDDPVWTFHDATTSGEFVAAAAHPNGTEIAVIEATDGDGPQSGRILILDPATGAATKEVTLEACFEPDGFGLSGEEWMNLSGYSPRGSWFHLGVIGTDCAEDPDSRDRIILDTTTWEEVMRVSDISGLQNGHITFSADETLALVHSPYDIAQLWSVPDFDLLQTFELSVGGRRSPWIAVISADGQHITGVLDLDDSDRPGFWSTATGEFLGWGDDYQGRPRHVVYTPDGGALVAGTDTAVMYAPATATADFTLHTNGGTYRVDIASQVGLAVTSSLDGEVEIWVIGAETGVPLQPGLGWVNPNDILEGAPLAMRAFSLDGGYSVFIVDAVTGKIVNEKVADGSSDRLKDGRFVIVDGGFGPEPQPGSREEQELWQGPVMIWDPVHNSTVMLRDCEVRWLGERQSDICPDGEPLYGDDVRASPDGSTIIGSAADGRLGIWDVQQSALVDTITPASGSGLLLVADTWFLTGGGREIPQAVTSLYAIDATTGVELAEFEGVWRWHTNAISHDNSRLFLMDQGGSVFEYDTSDWHLTRTWQAQESRTRGIAVSPDDSKLAVSGEAGLVWIWDIEGSEQRLLDRIPAGGDLISDITWIDDDHIGIVVVHGWGQVTWETVNLTTDAAVDDAIAALVRGFESEECERYSIAPCPTLDEMRDG